MIVVYFHIKQIKGDMDSEIFLKIAITVLIFNIHSTALIWPITHMGYLITFVEIPLSSLFFNSITTLLNLGNVLKRSKYSELSRYKDTFKVCLFLH